MHISDTMLSDPSAYGSDPSGPGRRTGPAHLLGRALLCAAVTGLLDAILGASLLGVP